MMTHKERNQTKEKNQKKAQTVEDNIKTVKMNIVKILKCLKQCCVKADEVFAEATNQQRSPEGMNNFSDVTLSSTR